MNIDTLKDAITFTPTLTMGLVLALIFAIVFFGGQLTHRNMQDNKNATFSNGVIATFLTAAVAGVAVHYSIANATVTWVFEYFLSAQVAYPIVAIVAVLVLSLFVYVPAAILEVRRAVRVQDTTVS